jgi:membrane protein required for colicin V production
MNLHWVDMAMLALLVISMLVGLMRGFVFELLSLAGWFAAYFSSLWFTPMAQPYIGVGAPSSTLNYGVSFACVFLASLIVWGLCARLVRALIRATPLSSFDRLLGLAFGLLRGMVVLLVVATVVSSSPLARTAGWQQSQGAIWLNSAVQVLKPSINKALPSPQRSSLNSFSNP